MSIIFYSFFPFFHFTHREAKKYLYRVDQINKFRTCDEIEGFKKRARSLIVIVSTPPTHNYGEFTEKVRHYNHNPPFNIKLPSIFRKFETYVSIYAAYLYDSVMLYANALDRLLKAKQEEIKKEKSLNYVPNLTELIIKEIASNGTGIIAEIIKQKKYSSITGSQIYIDQNGDSEGNFSVLVLKKYDFSPKDSNMSCDFHMRPIATFQGSRSGVYALPEYKFNSIARIEWPGGVVPQDEPQCGFENELCNKDDGHVTSMIIAVVLGLILFCSIVITISIYRKWKIELEIEGLLWKIEPQEIKGYFNNDIVSSPSKVSHEKFSIFFY